MGLRVSDDYAPFVGAPIITIIMYLGLPLGRPFLLIWCSEISDVLGAFGSMSQGFGDLRLKFLGVEVDSGSS